MTDTNTIPSIDWALKHGEPADIVIAAWLWTPRDDETLGIQFTDQVIDGIMDRDWSPSKITMTVKSLVKYQGGIPFITVVKSESWSRFLELVSGEPDLRDQLSCGTAWFTEWQEFHSSLPPFQSLDNNSPL